LVLDEHDASGWHAAGSYGSVHFVWPCNWILFSPLANRYASAAKKKSTTGQVSTDRTPRLYRYRIRPIAERLFVDLEDGARRPRVLPRPSQQRLLILALRIRVVVVVVVVVRSMTSSGRLNFIAVEPDDRLMPTRRGLRRHTLVPTRLGPS
jgi:hypothetical protein